VSSKIKTGKYETILFVHIKQNIIIQVRGILLFFVFSLDVSKRQKISRKFVCNTNLGKTNIKKKRENYNKLPSDLC
jgi:hypothetical protein